MGKLCCEYCHCVGFHLPNCPEYPEVKSDKVCVFCRDSILNGEEYVESMFKDGYAHLECMNLTKEDTIKWLGGEIRVDN